MLSPTTVNIDKGPVRSEATVSSQFIDLLAMMVKTFSGSSRSGSDLLLM